MLGLIGGASAGGSLDDVIGSQEQRRRDGETKRLGSIEIDDEFVFGGLLDGQICWLCAFENPVTVHSPEPCDLAQTRGIREQSTCDDVLSERVNCGQPISQRNLGELLSVYSGEPTRHNVERLRPLSLRGA